MLKKCRFRKNNFFKAVSLCCLLVYVCLFCGCEEDELGVYTLCSYQGGWKGNVCPTPAANDPYYDFWNIMTSGSDPDCADPGRSRRYRNAEVVIQTIIPVPGDSRKCWDNFDLVFFYGHHNMIVPPHPHDTFDYYNYIGGTWVHNSGFLDTIGWGHTTAYDYYPTRPITDANLHPGAVTYLYNRYTSSLLGGAYDYGGGSRPWQEHWNDPVQSFSYGELGDLDLEWLILHGCQAVITANADGSYNDLALRSFCPVSGKYHIIMGHYISYHTYMLKSLAPFANNLLHGVPIQCAYFDTDPDRNTSAIAAEQHPFPGWAASTMVNDKWRAPMDDNEDTCSFTMRWILPLISTAPSPFSPSPESPKTNALDMTKITVDSPKARRLLKADSIKIRRAKTDYIPTGELPVLKLESVNDDICQERLLAVADKFLTNKRGKMKVKSSGGTLALETEDASCWINRGSGSYNLTRTRNCMVVPTKIDHFNEVVQKALQHVGDNQLVDLIEGEEMDILFVSVVHNALSVAEGSIKDESKQEDMKKYKLVEEFKSDHYVGFGRRFKGVPIVGSRLVVRLDGNGELAMVQKNWRKITEVTTKKAVISSSPIPSLLVRSPGFFRQEGQKPVKAEDIRIRNMKCGYIEAPVNYRQEYLRPGCVVSFQVGPRGENFSQTTTPLEEDVKLEQLLGIKYRSQK
jgi:hypothetical protein